VAVLFGYYIPFFVIGQQWLLLGITTLALVTTSWTLQRTQCTRCFHLSCPINRVPEDVQEGFFSNYPEFAEAREGPYSKQRREQDIMNASEFPAFVRKLPEADLPFTGLRGWLLQSESGQILFNESDVEVSVPEHSHGDQWGVVIDGNIELTVIDQTKTYSRGDTYFIPAEAAHRARIHAGFRAVDYFADQDRYRKH
jgi:mannose-6-phosphate isomerase-like protein (cupin superfamily)